PPARASIWFPRQMPRVGVEVFISLVAVLIVLVQTFGSPGPLLITTPFGLYDITCSYVASQGRRTTLYPVRMMFRMMLYFTPVSSTTTQSLLLSPYSCGSLVETSGIKFKPSYLAFASAFFACESSTGLSDTTTAPIITPCTRSFFVSSLVSMP